MRRRETGYVYKITVDGTDIREYYDLEEHLPCSEVAELWLNDAAENGGAYLSSVFSGRVNVKLLTDVDEKQQNDKLEPGPIPLPPPEDDKLPK